MGNPSRHVVRVKQPKLSLGARGPRGAREGMEEGPGKREEEKKERKKGKRGKKGFQKRLHEEVCYFSAEEVKTNLFFSHNLKYLTFKWDLYQLWFLCIRRNMSNWT